MNKSLMIILSIFMTSIMYAPYPDDALRLLEGKTNLVPVAIIGSGPAGLSAAIQPARAGYLTVVFTGEKVGGEIMESPIVENWPGLPKTSGSECMRIFQKQVTELGAQIVHLSVTAINFNTWPYEITLSDGSQVSALVVILTMGASQKKLGIEGEELYWGKGMFSCGLCDAPYTKDKDTVVIGGGNIAIQRVLQLAPVARSITLIVPEAHLTADESMLKRIVGLTNVKPPQFNKQITKIIGDGNLINAIELIDTQTGKTSTFPTSSIFLSSALTANTDLVKGQLPLDDFGCIKLKGDGSQETIKEGVFAAGTDANYFYRQIPVILGEGTKAGMDALKSLAQWGLDGAARKSIEAHLYKPVLHRKTLVKEPKTDEELKNLLSSNLTLVEFYSPTCSVCKHIEEPVIQLASELKDQVDIIKVSKDTFKHLFEKYDITFVPTFILFSNAEEISRIEAVTSKEVLQEFLKSEGFSIIK